MKEEQSLHEKHPWSLLNDLSEQIDREVKRNNKIQRTCSSAHKKPFLYLGNHRIGSVSKLKKNIGDSNFLILWRETLQERLASQEEVKQWTNSEERECGNKFGRGRNLLRPLGANPIYSASKGGNMKTLSVSLNSNLAWGRRPRSEKATRCFLDSDWLIGLILDSDWL